MTHLVFFCDGSCRSNPGYAGSGIFGYNYTLVPKAKNNKHPNGKYYFTKNGLQDEKDPEVEVLKIYEAIIALPGDKRTNNNAELNSIIYALKCSEKIEDLKSLTIYTDSNYIVNAYNENLNKWILNNWRRQDNKEIVHESEWRYIHHITSELKQKCVEVNFIWIKGHSDNYGNNIADLYSAIGSNASRNNRARVVLNRELTFEEYKNSYEYKDILLYFKNLYFSSENIDDTTYCFLSSSDNDKTIGKRDSSSIFAVNIGYTPELINKIKSFYRNISRQYNTTCCAKLSKFENKDLLRLAIMLDIEDLVELNKDNSATFIRDTSSAIFETKANFPFINTAMQFFNYILSLDKNLDAADVVSFDITDYIVKDKKLCITNKDKYIDLTNTQAQELIEQKLLAKVGYDIPNYLSLKSIEKNIEQVKIVVQVRQDTSYVTLYYCFKTKNRILFTTNVYNKYLKSIKTI